MMCWILVGCGLTGCAPHLDPDEARLCRLAVVAVEQDANAIDVLRQATISRTTGEQAVRVDYLAAFDPAPHRSGFVECVFARSAVGTQPELVALRSRDRVFTETDVFFLKRFWLGASESQTADPQPTRVWSAAPSLPRQEAYLLQALINALPSVATYAMLAAAYSLIYGLVGRINLAFGEFAAIGGAASLLGLAGLSSDYAVLAIPVAFVLGIWAAGAHGLGIVRLVFIPLRRTNGQQGLVATIGLALVLNEYMRIAQGPSPRWIAPLRIEPLAIAISGPFLVTVSPVTVDLVLVSVGLACCVLLLMTRTQFGRNWRAMADDAEAAALLGVDRTRVFTQAFVLASALAGAAGALIVLVYGNFGTTLGATLGLKSLLAAVLGGIGSVPGALLGGIALGMLEAVWSASFPIEHRDFVAFLVLAGALIVRPGGILGYADGGPRRV